ncbi:helix-turn-helix domain-containing protein [Telmatocola sphagniphila]|uniref:helix-turn-helix domain-containing protein n=1 Tax=Telmatocola sphagniphila TaxID=1123043 RepID=UPI0036F447E0
MVELRDKGLTDPKISTALGISLRTVWRYMRLRTSSRWVEVALSGHLLQLARSSYYPH